MLKFSAYSYLTSDNRISFSIKSSRILLQLSSFTLSLKAIGSMSGLKQPSAITVTFRRWGRELMTHNPLHVWNHSIIVLWKLQWSRHTSRNFKVQIAFEILMNYVLYFKLLISYYFFIYIESKIIHLRIFNF